VERAAKEAEGPNTQKEKDSIFPVFFRRLLCRFLTNWSVSNVTPCSVFHYYICPNLLLTGLPVRNLHHTKQASVSVDLINMDATRFRDTDYE
jgi:hypothetical protein